VTVTGGTLVVGNSYTGDQRRVATLEAYADTFVPGERRAPGDLAIADAAPGRGAVAAGALELLETPATGVSAGLADLAVNLNAHATAYAVEHGITIDPEVPPFVGLRFADRTALVCQLISPSHPEKDIWVLVALFCFMAFDTAAHMHTADAIANGHPGLAAMGFAAPDADGLWRFPDFSYGRQLARPHPRTTSNGDPG
jgi:enediyne biosynthesis protein E8